MIVVARPAGQLANRLFQFSHFVALAIDTGVTVAQGYGMTELSPVSHTTPDEGLLPPGPDSSRYLNLARRRIFALECEDLNEAFAAAQRELNLCDSDSDANNALHFSVFATCALCTISSARSCCSKPSKWK